LAAPKENGVEILSTRRFWWQELRDSNPWTLRPRIQAQTFSASCLSCHNLLRLVPGHGQCLWSLQPQDISACSQIGAGFLGIPNYGNVAAKLAMIGNGALMSLLQSDSNQVAGRILDQQVRWRRYLVVFLGLRLRRSAPPTIPCPQTIHGLLMGQAAKTIAFMSMVAAIIAECIPSGRVDKPPGEHCGTFNCERA
jgi:hypothetical protein